MNQRFYSYRQGTAYGDKPLRIKPNRGSKMDYVYIVLVVLAFWIGVLVTYWGWKILVAPKLDALMHALGG